ncbi:hypothetical protein GW797_00295 [Candidatus Parcubacteria bacterium]|nr:hypothetical protein [Candidatus Parcubacteria bacterium]
MKIAILTSVTSANIYLVNSLTSRYKVVAKVIERRSRPSTMKEKMAVRSRLIQRYGLLKTLNKLLYNKYRSWMVELHQSETLKQELFPGKAEVAYTHEVPTLEVENINDSSCVDFLSGYAPDIIAVCGTTVIKAQVFKLAKKGTINIHSGIIPEYRSADPIFWALYNGEPDKVGVTIHYVDEGIDTGPIIHQKSVGVTKEDDLATLYAKCMRTGAELMSQAIEDIAGGTVKTYRKEGVEGRAHFHMDLGIWEYMVFQRRFKKLKSSL